jgi:hypothetical protein
VASAVFKTVARRLAPWVGSIPIHSRHRARDRTSRRHFVISRFLARFCGLTACAILLLVVVATPSEAQRADTARAGPARPAVRPPLSPRRAFLTSLLVPGYAQSVLGRPNAAALFVATEAVGLLMVRESAIELRQARRLQDDSIPLFFVDPSTGRADTVYRAARYPSDLVRARRAHLEDWIAALVANHIIAGVDAFVAAHLWDVPIQVGLRHAPRSAVVSARYRW